MELRWGRQRSIKNFAGETSWKMAAWKTDKEREDNIRLDLKEVDCKNRRWLELVQDQY
jgi:hypothetical protein